MKNNVSSHKKHNFSLLAALTLPILALASLTAYHQYMYRTGEDVILPISGYDPRDLLSGYYLEYKIDYGIKGVCKASPESITPALICLKPKFFQYGNQPSQECSLFIRGMCTDDTFSGGIEQFFMSEENSKAVEKLLTSGKVKTEVVLSVTKTGYALVKDILIDGQSASHAVEKVKPQDAP
jgi:uncharacterized membrane-anchored protein